MQNKLCSITSNQTIVTISNHTKYSIAYFLPDISTSNFKVYYAPLKKYNFVESQNDNQQIFNSLCLEHGKYILLVCGNRHEKGAYRACRVLFSLIENNIRIPQNIKILVLGISNFKPYKKLVKGNSQFIFHGYVSTNDLEVLYKNAYLFLYPTLNEGFGYPPLEAMKYGTLCACSANSAITEIYGDSVIYFNPFDEIEMCNRILQCFDEEVRREKSKKIAERYKLIRERQENDLSLLIQEIINNV